MNWAIVTAIGTVLGGLALPLAFVQLGALRQDRLRGQVSRVGAWTGAPGRAGDEPGSWTIPVLIHNGSELPVQIDAVDLALRSWGYERMLAAPEGTTEVEYYMAKKFGPSDEAAVVPGTIAPGETWNAEYAYAPQVAFERPEPPVASVTRVVITDAAGFQWEKRSSRAGPARRVRRWRRWWWNRRADL